MPTAIPTLTDHLADLLRRALLFKVKYEEKSPVIFSLPNLENSLEQTIACLQFTIKTIHTIVASLNEAQGTIWEFWEVRKAERRYKKLEGVYVDAVRAVGMMRKADRLNKKEEAREEEEGEGEGCFIVEKLIARAG
ncbi:uncharacterized protein KY384_007992 [Bacidia gigantensis]|uniref:uncharacterized protein n=1 Tax=Bacidia gigantensis TaxID=2732470 RepID=UPI001D0392A0|nr:uncharacterized protein KY384_007992 [Bacidia gigantensis]KAG8527248.1 hypothetical protein KY384_007992 [Bacidia gigantensis]